MVGWAELTVDRDLGSGDGLVVRGWLGWAGWFGWRRGRVVRRLVVSPGGVTVELGRGQRVSADFGEVKELRLKGRFLPVVLGFRCGEVSYGVYGFRRRGLEAAYEAMRGGVQLQGLRSKWGVALGAWEALEKLLEGPGYVTDRQVRQWRRDHRLPALPDGRQWRNLIFSEEERAILPKLKNPRGVVEARNGEFVAREMGRWKDFFDGVEKYPLTKQQRLAVVTDEDNTLVLAGAGTGKTSTLMAKVGYLLKSGLAKPEELLLVSFTRKSADEMQARIRKKLAEDVTVRTFHSLGLEIVSEVEGRKPLLARSAEDPKVLGETLLRLIKLLIRSDFKFLWALQSFLTSDLLPYKSATEFRSQAAYEAWLRDSGMRALSGDQLKSYEEIEIANWLFLNGVRFHYERPYEFNTASREFRQYQPDFYYPDYGIYHEHFGVDKHGRTAPYVDQERYWEGIRWKRHLHDSNGTALIETFSWMKTEGVLLEELEKMLLERGVTLRPLPPEDVLAQFERAKVVNPLLKLLSTFLAVFKGSCMSEAELEERAHKSDRYNRNQTFLKIFLPLFHAYEENHRARGEVDFDDMIRRAVDYVRRGEYQSPFRYILVDEFQDISRGRAELLKALRGQVAGSRLFCVGDDWQSIYRFTGSDLDIVTGFSRHFGATQTVALDRTFRFNDKLVDFSSRFILKNESQLRKTLTPHRKMAGPAVELAMVLRDAEEGIYGQILQRIEGESRGRSVFFLGRNRYVLPDKGAREALREEFPGLKITFLTAHKSKGLEADYVILCGLKGGRLGFPSEIVDDDVLDLVLAKPDQFPNGEERRLFYVAVTRARHKVYLVGDAHNPSPFLQELMSEPAYGVQMFSAGGAEEADTSCPGCGVGMLMVRQGATGPKFAGCSSYPHCDHTQAVCSTCEEGFYVVETVAGQWRACNECGDLAEVCQECGEGTLVRREGPYGSFWACSQYFNTGCDHTRSV